MVKNYVYNLLVIDSFLYCLHFNSRSKTTSNPPAKKPRQAATVALSTVAATRPIATKTSNPHAKKPRQDATVSATRPIAIVLNTPAVLSNTPVWLNVLMGVLKPLRHQFSSHLILLALDGISLSLSEPSGR
jgi:hypothetical protein